MSSFEQVISKEKNNFVFIGEAGSGKSEISINLALELAKKETREVHFFDLDMSKPLFRSRDLEEELTKAGVKFHAQEQFMDAPTIVGGVNTFLKKKDCVVVLDVGGDYIGARSLGSFATLLNQDDTEIYYVLNALRPWSYDIDHIDETLGKILGVSHLQLQKLRFIDNPNNGITTTKEEYLEASKEMQNIISPFASLQFSCVQESLYKEVVDEAKLDVVPIQLYLTYSWIKED